MPIDKEEKSKKGESMLFDKTKQTNKTAQWEAAFPQSAEATTLLLSDSQHGETFAVWIHDALWDASPTFVSASVRDRPCSSGICSLTAESRCGFISISCVGFSPFRLQFWEII